MHTCNQAFRPPSGGGSSRKVDGVMKRCSAFVGREAERRSSKDCVLTVRTGSMPSFSSSSRISRAGPGSATGTISMIQRRVLQCAVERICWTRSSKCLSGRKEVTASQNRTGLEAAGAGQGVETKRFLKGETGATGGGTDSERSRERWAEGARHRLGLPMHNRKSASEPGSDVHPPALSASVRPSHTSTLCIVASIHCSRHMTHRCRTKMHRACSPRSILRGNKRTIACERLRSAKDTHNSCRLPSLPRPQRFRGLLCVYEGDLSGCKLRTLRETKR